MARKNQVSCGLEEETDHSGNLCRLQYYCEILSFFTCTFICRIVGEPRRIFGQVYKGQRRGLTHLDNYDRYSERDTRYNHNFRARRSSSRERARRDSHHHRVTRSRSRTPRRNKKVKHKKHDSDEHQHHHKHKHHHKHNR